MCLLQADSVPSSIFVFSMQKDYSFQLLRRSQAHGNRGYEYVYTGQMLSILKVFLCMYTGLSR